jgi:hypothetical protein
MTDASERPANPDRIVEPHLADLDAVVGCVEIWEGLSAVRERRDRESDAE